MRVSIGIPPRHSSEGNWGGGIARCVKCDDSLAVLVMEEEPKIINVGQWGTSQNTRVIDKDGISYAVTNGEKDGVPKIIEPMCSVHPLSHKLEFNPTSSIKDIAPALRATDYKAPHVVYEPQVLTPKRTDFGKAIRKQYENGEIQMSRHSMTQLEPRQDGVSNTLTSVQKDNLVYEPTIAALRGRNPDNPNERGKSNGQYKQRLEMNNNGTSNTLTSVQKDNLVVEPLPNELNENWNTIIGNKQLNPFRGSVDEYSPCVTSACGAGGGMTPMLTDADIETTKSKEFIEQIRGHRKMEYRIRKLTPKECFRLMDVDDADIDKIQAAGISNSQQYKMAGNSIVVACLYHLFRKMFTETHNEDKQLTLW